MKNPVQTFFYRFLYYLCILNRINQETLIRMNMETLKKHLLLLLLLVPSLLQAMEKAIPFTLDDRDRIIRTEQKVESLQTEMNLQLKATDQKIDDLRSEMNARFEAIDERFSQLFGFLWAIIGIFTTMLAAVFGFAFWDRKLSLAPMKAENLKTLNALREFAEHQPKLREILKNAGLM